MRVIAGQFRGRVLKGPSGSKTRPTSDRLRETLFNIIAPRVDDETRFLDLCAGTGAVGIEAVSRGAGFVTFVDKSRRSCELVETNLDLLGIPEKQTEILALPAETFAARKHEQAWDIVYFDPPYDFEYALVLLELADPTTGLLSEGGLFIVEHHAKNYLPDAVGDLRRWRIVKQGESRLSFYEAE
jgi:16S rRNA (guanine(966)-N(2))-methyltransferase RsmD